MLRVGAVLAGSVGLGLLGGWLWWTWWGPATPGRIYDVPERGPRWYPEPWDPGQTDAFGGTAQYIVIALGLGLLLGLVAGLLAGRTALLMLGAMLAGSVLAALAMVWLGTQLSPPDPQTLATAATVGDKVPGNLEVTMGRISLLGWDDVPVPTPYFSWPVAGLTGYLVVMLSAKSLGEVRARENDPTTWLEAAAR
ncbi:hypothetical protein HNR19_001693 [Nocardioides thalensis]|uniref:DUF2567 domain-containing protein n=1 Tax=Nocardioides thalensis TaxID=1914755 RepID=A0A853C0D6_9ACTN|nr:hypothetical protein [Nocardioides thalensis]NYJ00995.1 hypothetical protein [Nocardioides thalensis]